MSNCLMRKFSANYSFAMVAGLFFAGMLAAAPPVDELLRLTPRDVTFVAVAKDLRNNAAAIQNGPFAEAFRQSKLAREIAANAEIKHLEETADQVGRALHTDWTRVRDDLIGDAVVLAYRGGPPGAPVARQLVSTSGRAQSRLTNPRRRTAYAGSRRRLD